MVLRHLYGEMKRTVPVFPKKKGEKKSGEMHYLVNAIFTTNLVHPSATQWQDDQAEQEIQPTAEKIRRSALQIRRKERGREKRQYVLAEATEDPQE